MTWITLRSALSVLTLFAASANALAAQAARVVTLDVPQLATAGGARGFDFVSFQFDIYLIAMGDPSGSSDYAANVIANGHENYTFLSKIPCGGSGRGGGYCTSSSYRRTNGSTYSDTYLPVSNPPTQLDVFFHFSAADVAGKPLAFTVSDSGNHSLSLTADAGNVPVVPGTPLENGRYTLEYKTDSLQGVQIVISAVPEPATASNMLTGIALLFSQGIIARRRKGK